jgi:hypothetical protein
MVGLRRGVVSFLIFGFQSSGRSPLGAIFTTSGVHHFNACNRSATSSALPRLLKALMRK